MSTLLWLLMALSGISGIEGIRDQNVPGDPNAGQFRLYIVTPLVGLAGSATLLGFAKRLPSWAKRIGLGISVFMMLLVFMTFGGGV